MHRLFSILFLSLALIQISKASADTPILVKDINTTEQSAAPGFTRVSAGGKVFFTRNLKETGTELWVSDGTATGTVLLKEIVDGPVGGGISKLTAVFNLVAFVADDGIHGKELWRSDGTALGTFMVQDIQPPAATIAPFDLSFSPSGVFLFVADDGVNGPEVWRSNLSSNIAGTIRITDLAANASPREPIFFFGNPGAGVYFSADMGAPGRELVRLLANGGGFNPPEVFDIRVGPADSNPNFMTVAGSKIFFFADDGTHGQELHTITPASGAITFIQDLNTAGGSFSVDPGVVPFSGGVFYYGTDSVRGLEPRFSDGTQNNIQSFEINPGIFGSRGTAFDDFAVLGSEIFFPAERNTDGLEIWKGTSSGVSQVADLAQGDLSSDPQGFTAFNNAVFFSADDFINGEEIWRINSGLLTLLKDFLPGPAGSEPIVFGATQNALLVSALQNPKSFIWTSDGTEIGTQPVFDLGVGGTRSSSAADFDDVGGGRFIFWASTAEFGEEVWVSDGSTAGTNLVTEFEIGSREIDTAPVDDFMTLGAFGIFQLFDSQLNRTVWRSDGTVPGTFLLPLSSIGVHESSSIFLGNIAVFDGRTAAEGSELWVTDGTLAGTQQLTSSFFLQNSINSNQPALTDFTVLGERAVFAADTAANGRELFITDGTSAATGLLKDILPGSIADGNPQGMIELNGKVIFVADFPNNAGRELGITDGTDAGTTLLVDLAPQGTNIAPIILGKAGGLVFFSTREPDFTRTLRRTDGTEAGTIVLKTGSAEFSVSGSSLVALGPKFFFQADSDQFGREPWVSDGTPQGTLLLKDIFPGSADSSPDNFIEIAGTVYFSATDELLGNELWKSAGTPAGTVLAADILPGPDSSSPFGFFPRNGTLFFSANGPAVGRELFNLVVDECPDDPNKLLVGNCGCGVADVDLNANGILDCFTAPELNHAFRLKLEALQGLLVKLKVPKSVKAKKKAKKLKKGVKLALADLQEFVSANLGGFSVQGGADLNSLTSDLLQKARKALKLKSSVKKDKKGALKAIAEILAALG